MFLAAISEDGTKPLKSFCFESNLGVALKVLKIILSLKYNKTNSSFYFMFCLLIKGKIFEIGFKKN